MSTSDWIALGSAVATFLSVVVAGFALWCQLAKLNQQLVLQNFADYTKRYQEIIQKFPEDINEQNFQIEGRDDYKVTMRAMRTYFDLSFEEWYLNERVLIDARIWTIWKGGIATAMSKPAFRQAWAIILKDTKYCSNFESFIETQSK